MFTLLNSIMSSILLRVPVCYFLGITLGWGLRGVGMGAPIASAGVLLVIVIYLFTGKWKHNVIDHRPAHATCAAKTIEDTEK